MATVLTSKAFEGPAAAARDALAGRVLQAAGGVFDLFGMYLGDRLGFYQVLAADGPLRPRELAARTGTAPRYVREWLEQQTVSGVVRVERAEAPEEERRFYLPAGHDEVLVDADSPNYLVPLAQAAAGALRPLEKLVQAYRTGEGVPFDEYGPDLREGQGRMNRVVFLQQLGREWLPSIPDIHARLGSAPPARVADLGCGVGWSSIGIAASYPCVQVDGFDLDAPSIDLARAHASRAGLSDRVRFHARDAGDPGVEPGYDLVTAFECIHDMSDPVRSLSAMRTLAAPGGAVIVMDERVGDQFTAEGSDLEWLMYGFSILHCLPVSLAEEPAAGTGTVMRVGTLRRYAQAAGFADVEVLPIDHPMFRFYRLR
ncbi:MAG TPA: class I SAM-dependent methyltransferase [Vicinamibacterales bacterium]|nr:class I SAM-dependent methyltransferase [Vicinamibacterales bacterium]